MLARRRLRTFGEVQEGQRYELYYPGTVAKVGKLIPSVVEESFERSVPIPFYSPGWSEPKRVKGIEGEKLKKFKTGRTLREWGKESIFKRLQIIPTPIPYKGAMIPGAEEIRQPPHYFVDGVPSFGEVPFGVGNTFGQSPEGATRGWWGELISSISVGAEKFLDIEKQKYQARLESAKVAQAGLIPAPVTTLETVGASKIIPLIALGGIAFLILRKRGKGKRK